MGTRIRRTAAVAGCLTLLAGSGVADARAPHHAAGMAPDRAFATPVAAGSSKATTSLSAGQLRHGLAKALRSAKGRSGAWVYDATGGRVLFKSAAKSRLAIASNMKLFTTATALSRIGPEETLNTQLWAVGRRAGARLNGYLVLRGAGDPGFGVAGLRRLATALKRSGIRRVKGRLHFDDYVFDSRRTVPQRGITGGPFLGMLSGLSYEFGAARNPGFAAAVKLRGILRKRGIRIGTQIRRRKVKRGAANAELIGAHESAPLASIAAQTNTHSDNFYAEMVLKLVGARVRGRGTTRHGLAVVRGFAAKRGAAVVGENGSGLSVLDRASPLAIGRLLRAMHGRGPAAVRDAFRDSLAVAGRTGTLAGRMRGSGAQNRCRGKTGTLTSVSALSGYCVAGGRTLIFSIVNNRVNTDRARRAQDRMAALIARYR